MVNHVSPKPDTLSESDSTGFGMSAVQPLRQSLLAAQNANLPELGCSSTWLDGLRKFQTVPGKIASACSKASTECEIPHQKLLLEDLVDFEKGIASVQDSLKAFDRLCYGSLAKPSYCGYYLEHRDDQIGALDSLVSSHYREKPEARTALWSIFSEAETCAADRTFLTSSNRLVSGVDSTARPRTLADFERLGETISAMRVAMQTEDTRVRSAPAGGMFTVQLPKDASLPILQFLGLISILYAFLHVRRLRRLATAHTLDNGHLLYSLYPVASHAFTAPVFGVRTHGDPASRSAARFSAHMTSIAFDWIPLIALSCAGAAVLGALFLRLLGNDEFSPWAIALAAIFFALQLVVTLAYRSEQHVAKDEFNQWVSQPPDLPQEKDPKGDLA
ncbi:hypothetical protein GCM10011349_47020 [Novosphingobium indicum]|uniref:Uncharacterized protein n=1 Tax=Novosphingobium indicum TaxID=462949 RepID=A0ABQ2K1U6_9SPHN